MLWTFVRELRWVCNIRDTSNFATLHGNRNQGFQVSYIYGYKVLGNQHYDLSFTSTINAVKRMTAWNWFTPTERSSNSKAIDGQIQSIHPELVKRTCSYSQWFRCCRKNNSNMGRKAVEASTFEPRPLNHGHIQPLLPYCRGKSGMWGTVQLCAKRKYKFCNNRRITACGWQDQLLYCDECGEKMEHFDLDQLCAWIEKNTCKNKLSWMPFLLGTKTVSIPH